MNGEFFTDFKSLNGIEISWFVQVLSNFNWLRGVPPGGVADGWIGVEVGMGVWGMSYACIHTHTHAHMHTHMHMHVKHDKHGCLHVGGHLQFLYMYTCACMCVHACACMCMHVGTPPMPPDAPRCPQTPPPPSHLPPPQSCREPITPNFNNSWTNRDNSILFEDSLPVNIPELI